MKSITETVTRTPQVLLKIQKILIVTITLKRAVCIFLFFLVLFVIFSCYLCS